MIQVFLSFTRSQAAPELQVIKLSFISFVIFVKNRKLQSRFSQRRKKIFDFSGRFSESLNDCLSVELPVATIFFNLIAFRRKIA
jgi:hypothetical protein